MGRIFPCMQFDLYMAFNIFDHALSLSGFVICMMLLVEYFHSSSRATFMRIIKMGGISSYLIAASLAAIPGCFGCFLIVTCYIHGLISIGVLIVASVVTIGDVAFVLIARDINLYLKLLFLTLSVGLLAGFVIDRLDVFKKIESSCDQLIFHPNEDGEKLTTGLIANLKKPSRYRILLLVCYVLFCVALVSGKIGHLPLIPVVIFFLILVGVGVFYVVISASDHFIEEHFIGHVFKKHFPRLFAWSVLAFTVVTLSQQNTSFESFIQSKQWVILLLTILLGFIPDSGPHLLFFTLYWNGQIDFTILLVSSIVQDGHGLVPLLAISRRDFFRVKLVNTVIALLVTVVSTNFNSMF